MLSCSVFKNNEKFMPPKKFSCMIESSVCCFLFKASHTMSMSFHVIALLHMRFFHCSEFLCHWLHFVLQNPGVFFIRRSKWSENFLDVWWNQTTFISFGSTKSGDNAAFKHFMDNLPPDELRQHIQISPMQCLFNSYQWFLSWKSALRLFTSPSTTWKGAYSHGDFMVHFAGIDEKQEWAEKILREMESN
ncbi:Glycosyltransferase 34 protein [Dioscorea alata]|uniref:Glycosyltransferase 34 protein n=1 Tax=Dioscorea alata TaxID=55571 RepID=A0ACB7WQY8_DIOAL|nr:Glycosyltransferase 34 protein [Dioscorea alata]